MAGCRLPGRHRGLHIAVVPEHLREAPYAGALFIGLSAAALAAALLLVRTRHALVWLGAVSLCLTALLGYVHLALGRAPFDV